MTDDVLPPGYDFPAGFDPHAADHLERVESADGTEFVVLAPGASEPAVVHADVVEYKSFDHPVLTGFSGFVWIVAAFVAPLLAAYAVAPTVGGVPVAIGGTAASVVVGWLLARLLLYRTILGDWIWRFLEWNDHRAAIVAARQAGGVA